jgi:tetratricopeptide (TPR) repeat protein
MSDKQQASAEYAQNIYQLLLAEMAVSREEYNNALALYINLSRNTKNEEIIKNAISLAVSLKADEVANQLINEWVDEAPESIAAKVYLVRMNIVKGNLKQAEDLLNQIPPNKEYHDEITYLKSLVLIDMKDTTKALGLLESLDHSKYESEASFFAGQIYEVQNKTDLAISWYSKVSEGKYYFQAQVRLAMLFIQKGLYAKALASVSYLKPSNKTEAITKVTIQADLELMLNKNEEAITTLTKGLALSPHDLNYLYMRGLAYANIGKLSLAQDDFEEVIANEPNNADVLNAFGYALTNNSDRYKEAYELISKALKLSPDSPAIQDSMGWVLYKLGENKQALKYLEQAYQTVPEGEIGAHYAVVLYSLGDKDKSQEVVNKIKALQPNNKHAIDILNGNGINLKNEK